MNDKFLQRSQARSFLLGLIYVVGAATVVYTTAVLLAAFPTDKWTLAANGFECLEDDAVTETHVGVSQIRYMNNGTWNITYDDGGGSVYKQKAGEVCHAANFAVEEPLVQPAI